MSSLSSTLFLGLLLAFSLGLYFISNVLDLMKLAATQKLVILKTGLLFLMLAPFIFLALEAISFKSIEIKMPSLYIDPVKVPPDYLPPMQQKVYWPFCLSLFYGLGVSLVTLQLVRNYYLTRKWLADSISATLQGQVVQLSSQITSPLSFGFFSPKIYFPQIAQETWTAREIRMGLSHEQNHILRQDPFWKLISLFVRSLLFFAPWMYVLHKKIELEMEILCDETTCAQTQASHEEYGLLLLRLVCQVDFRSLVVTNITDSTIKRRIIAMKSRKIQRPVFTAALSACILLVGTIAIATSSGVTEKKSTFKISSVVFINGKEVSRPRVIVLANDKAEMTQKSADGSEFKMVLVANDVSMPKLENGIGINLDIQYRFGNSTSHNAPQMILAPNKEGSITVAGEDGQVFEMRIKAERQ